MTESGGPTTDQTLEAYFAANRDTVTEDVLTAEAKAAGHTEEAIQQAWIAVKGGLPPPRGGRAARYVLMAYGITFGILSLLMLLFSSGNRGEFIPTGAGGIAVLAGALLACLVASAIWIGSRRAFWSIVALLAIPAVLSAISSSPIWAVALAVGIAALLWFEWRPGSRDVGPRADLSVLLVVPILLLLGVAGACLASGLPLPYRG